MSATFSGMSLKMAMKKGYWFDGQSARIGDTVTGRRPRPFGFGMRSVDETVHVTLKNKKEVQIFRDTPPRRDIPAICSKCHATKGISINVMTGEVKCSTCGYPAGFIGTAKA